MSSSQASQFTFNLHAPSFSGPSEKVDEKVFLELFEDEGLSLLAVRAFFEQEQNFYQLFAIKENIYHLLEKFHVEGRSLSINDLGDAFLKNPSFKKVFALEQRDSSEPMQLTYFSLPAKNYMGYDLYLIWRAKNAVVNGELFLNNTFELSFIDKIEDEEGNYLLQEILAKIIFLKDSLILIPPRYEKNTLDGWKQGISPHLQKKLMKNAHYTHPSFESWEGNGQNDLIEEIRNALSKHRSAPTINNYFPTTHYGPLPIPNYFIKTSYYGHGFYLGQPNEAGAESINPDDLW